jgi:class 3 adenylate cyclase
MLPRSNRTLICSVVFLDIVDYSKKPVAEQIRMKEWLNAVLAEALKDVAANDRIILDTGDGVAISFLGDPEDALFVCLTVRDAVNGSQAAQPMPLAMRTGINLGPVKLIKDLNEQLNIIGDGINVAQRVMSFAAPNEVLVSRSYYEVVSCLSDAYARLFQYQGSRTDKHVREHEVYAVGESSQELRHVINPAHAASRGHEGFAATTVIGRFTHSASLVNDNLRRRPWLGTAVAVMAILVVAVVLRGLREQPATRAEKPTAVVTAPVPVSPAPDKAVPAPASRPTLKERDPPPATTGERGVEGTPKPATSGERGVEGAPKLPATAKRGLESTPKPAVTGKQGIEGAPKPAATGKRGIEGAPTTAERGVEGTPKPAAASGTGIVTLTITPWGEIHVDGKLLGEVPPMHELRLSPGRHRIEIRNPDYPPYVQTVEVRAGERIPIRHWFQKERVPLPWK